TVQCSYCLLTHIVAVDTVFFFFSSRRRHTRSYGDWSSDVCSSDLDLVGVGVAARCLRCLPHDAPAVAEDVGGDAQRVPPVAEIKIGRASCRERVQIEEGEGGGKEKRGEISAQRTVIKQRK